MFLHPLASTSVKKNCNRHMQLHTSIALSVRCLHSPKTVTAGRDAARAPSAPAPTPRRATPKIAVPG